MAGSLGDDDEEITGINVTPLVDVMLVLLIIFMVTSSYIVNRSIDIKLPSAQTAENSVAKTLSFALNQESKLYLDDKEISFDEISEQIKKALSDGGTPVHALISADEKTPHGQVVKLIDTVRKNGITDFAINVEAVTTGSTPSSHEDEG